MIIKEYMTSPIRSTGNSQHRVQLDMSRAEAIQLLHNATRVTALLDELIETDPSPDPFCTRPLDKVAHDGLLAFLERMRLMLNVEPEKINNDQPQNALTRAQRPGADR